MPHQSLAHHQHHHAPIAQGAISIFPAFNGGTKQRFNEQETDTRAITNFHNKANFVKYGTFNPPNPTPNGRYNKVFQVPGNYLGLNIVHRPLPGGRESAVPHYAPPPVPERFILRNSLPPRQYLQI